MAFQHPDSTFPGILAFRVVRGLSQLLFPAFHDMIVLKFRTIQGIAAIHTECHMTSRENIPLEGSPVVLPSYVFTDFLRARLVRVRKEACVDRA